MNSDHLEVPILTAESHAMPTRQQINEWMAQAGWQDYRVREGHLPGVEQGIRKALAAAKQGA